MDSTPTAMSDSSPAASRSLLSPATSSPPGLEGLAPAPEHACGVCPLRSRWLWLPLCVAAVVAVDQFTKTLVTRHLRATALDPLYFFDGLLRVQYAENNGAFLSLMSNLPPDVRFWVLTVANGLILTGLAVFLLSSRSVDAWTWWALVLILAGGLGNLIDRIRLDGRVIDFLNVGLGRLRTGIFNVADIAITVGFLMLIPRALLPEKKPASPRIVEEPAR